MKKKNIYMCLGLILILVLSLGLVYPKQKENEKLKNNIKGLISYYIEKNNNVYEQTTKRNWPTDGYVLNKVKSSCENDSILNWVNNKVQITGNKSDKCNIYFDKKEKNFEYTNSIQEFIAPIDGTYKLEVWGAQGGATYSAIEVGGLGGYASGEIDLKTNEKIYIVVGGQGEFYNGIGAANQRDYQGGYNGGGIGGSAYKGQFAFAGGGATHIARVKGLLSTLKDQQDQLIIVAGGGGGNGGTNSSAYGGSGGGFQGMNGINSASPYIQFYGTGATQEKGGDDIYFTNDVALGTFGQGGKYYIDALEEANFYGAGAGGGGGYYGGGGSSRGHAGAGGGSGYIGNPLLKNKVMYCYNCTESTADDTRTYTTNNASESPISQYAKRGNGYARITYLGK